jgi:hypothetical protein
MIIGSAWKAKNISDVGSQNQKCKSELQPQPPEQHPGLNLAPIGREQISNQNDDNQAQQAGESFHRERLSDCVV